MFLLLTFLLSCTTSKSTLKPNEAQVVKAQTKVTSPKKDTIITPSTQDVIFTTDVIKVDTVIWTDISAENTPISNNERSAVINGEDLDFKKEYNIKLLVPLNSDGNGDPASSRFVHFYAGALQAFEKLDEEGVKLNVKVIDMEEGSLTMEQRLGDFITDDTDMIIGPFEREDLKILTEICKQKSIPLVSPWQTSTKLTFQNPYYIQMKPNLKEHFLKLAENTSSTYSQGEVVIIGKNNKETNSWVKYFQDVAQSKTQIKDYYKTYFVTSDSLNAGPTAFFRMFKDPKIKAVILPNYSYSDEDFVYASLRRLAAEKAGRQISVFGMPILYDSDKLDFDFYNSLQMKVVMSDFVDENHRKIREFRRDYLDKYGEIPNPDAVKGYDLILYMGRNIWKYGKKFQNYLEYEATSYLQSTYDIRKAKSEDSPLSSDPEIFDFFENKHLDIIEFKGNKWQRKF